MSKIRMRLMDAPLVQFCAACDKQREHGVPMLGIEGPTWAIMLCKGCVAEAYSWLSGGMRTLLECLNKSATANLELQAELARIKAGPRLIQRYGMLLPGGPVEKKSDGDLVLYADYCASRERLDAIYTDRLNRAVSVENALLEYAQGKRELTREDARKLAHRLGIPDEYRAPDAHAASFEDLWVILECGEPRVCLDGIADVLASEKCQHDSPKSACRECIQEFGRFAYQKGGAAALEKAAGICDAVAEEWGNPHAWESCPAELCAERVRAAAQEP